MSRRPRRSRSRFAALRAALRIARREARRSRGRSILVVAMIGIPVLALTGVDVLLRTAQLSPAEEIPRVLGRADASVQALNGPVEQDPVTGAAGTVAAGRTPTQGQLLSALSPDSRVLVDRSVPIRVRTRAGLALTELRGFDYADPMAAGLVRQLAGRPPQAASEVALTHPLAAQLGLRVGDTLRTVRPDASFCVVGLVQDRYERRSKRAYALPAALAAVAPAREAGETYLVDAPGEISWSQVRRLNALGFAVRSRDVVLHPPPRAEVPSYEVANPATSAQALAAGTLAVGMALLEVVLLAGPAFAVGARRRRRDLALVAVAGGERGQVRNIVLADGLVLGAVAAIAGLALGAGLAVALLPLLTHWTGTTFGPVDVRPLELGGLAAVAVGTGVASALLPARAAARQDVVAALAGRRPATRIRRRVPLAGIGVAVLGCAVTLAGVRAQSVALLLAGAVLGEVGLIVATPALIALTARLGGRLPLSPRIALRDAARNRASVAPAVAAVMAAVAGSVAIRTVVASIDAHDRRSYRPDGPPNSTLVQLNDRYAAAQAPAVAAALRRALPDAQVVVVTGTRTVGQSGGRSVDPAPPRVQGCEARDEAELRRVAKDPRCQRVPRSQSGLLGSVLVDDGTALPALTGAPTGKAVTALRAGRVVVFDSWLVADGRITLRVTDEAHPDATPRELTVPASVQTSGFAPGQLVLPPRLASRLGVAVGPTAVLAVGTRPPTEKEEQAARGALARLGVDTYLHVERGYVSRYGLGLLALAAGAAVITLGAAMIATALANEDGRRDLATLGAVGASPTIRRLVSMSRAGVVAGLGTALGTVAGFVPAVGLILAQRHLEAVTTAAQGTAPIARPLAVPWLNLAVTAVVVPLLAVGVAALTRARLPVERRTAT